MHIDLNSFFASAEQQANPFLRNKSMGVGRRAYWGSAIIAASYPAKKQGIGLSTRYNEAKQIDPTFELANIDHIKYYELHTKFIDLLKKYSPLIEVYSIDEAFLDLTMTDKDLYELEEIGYNIKQSIIDGLGVTFTCSIGLGNNKLLAKVASNYDKPDGLSVIAWEERAKYLDPMLLEDIWGIGRRITKKMYSRGIYKVRDLKALSDKELYTIVGGYYLRLKSLLHGYHFEPIKYAPSKPAQSMQHAHTLDQATNNISSLQKLARKLIERIAIRLRKHRQKCRTVYLNLVPENSSNYGWGAGGWFHRSKHLPGNTNNGYTIYQVCKHILGEVNLEQTRIRQLVVGVGNLTTPDMISFEDLQQTRTQTLDKALDRINSRFGNFTIRSADILYEKAKESELNIETPEMRFHTL